MGDAEELYADNVLLRRRCEEYRVKYNARGEELAALEASRRKQHVRHEQTLSRERAVAVERITLLEAQVRAADERDAASRVGEQRAMLALALANGDVVNLRRLNARIVDEVQRVHAALALVVKERDELESRVTNLMTALSLMKE